MTVGKNVTTVFEVKEYGKYFENLLLHENRCLAGELIGKLKYTTCHCRLKEGNILLNDTLNTFYLWLYGVRHMVILYPPSQRQDSMYHDLCYTSHGEIAQWPIAPWANTLTTELHLTPCRLRWKWAKFKLHEDFQNFINLKILHTYQWVKNSQLSFKIIWLKYISEAYWFYSFADIFCFTWSFHQSYFGNN